LLIAKARVLLDDTEVKALNLDNIAERQYRYGKEVRRRYGELRLPFREFVTGHPLKDVRDAGEKAAVALAYAINGYEEAERSGRSKHFHFGPLGTDAARRRRSAATEQRISGVLERRSQRIRGVRCAEATRT
jgi:hypothetical protein